MNPITGSVLKSNNFELMKAARRTIVTLIVLFATSIVLSNFLACHRALGLSEACFACHSVAFRYLPA